MRQSKAATVAQYRDQFLAEKSDDYKNKFDQKNLDQQYAAIANWKNNAKKFGMATKDLVKVSAKTVMGYLKDAHKNLVKLENLNPKEQEKIVALLDKVKDTINNFDRVKKEQLLNNLKNEKEKLAKQGCDLDRKIEELQNQLG